MTAPSPGSATPDPTGEISGNLIDIFCRTTQPLYAVLDSARDGKILPLLEQNGCDHRILYGSRLAATVDGLGPYLVSLSPRAPFLSSLLEKCWGNSWGIFLTSPAGFAAVFRHLRRLLTVRLPDGSYALFRFYDPRVLPEYLSHLDNQHIEKFYGPIQSIYIETAGGQELCCFSRTIQQYSQHPSGAILEQDLHVLSKGGC
jgi:hypothetical protein